MRPALLDTDTVSYFFRRNSQVVSRVDEYLKEHGFIYVSVVTYYEVLSGLYYKDASAQLARFDAWVMLNQVLPLTPEIASRAAQIFAQLRSQGQPIGHNDVLIAATALAYDLTVITNNRNHFSRVTGLEIDNWS